MKPLMETRTPIAKRPHAQELCGRTILHSRFLLTIRGILEYLDSYYSRASRRCPCARLRKESHEGLGDITSTSDSAQQYDSRSSALVVVLLMVFVGWCVECRMKSGEEEVESGA